jgi:hypothetical protein
MIPTAKKGKSTQSQAAKRVEDAKNVDRRKKRSKVGDQQIVIESTSPHVVERKLDYSKKFPSSISLTPTIEDLTGGSISSDEFLSSIFRKRAAHITCVDSSQDDVHRIARVDSLCKEMYDLDVKSLLHNTSSENIFLWFREPRNDKSQDAKSGRGEQQNVNYSKLVRTADSLIRSTEISDPDEAFSMHKTGGHATYCRAPPEIEQNLVSSLLKATGLGCGQYDPSGESMECLGRGEVETFISTPNHVTDWHYDFQDNYTIQLSGIKRWTLQQGTILDPLRGCTPHYESPGSVESQLTAAYLFDRKFVFGKPTVPTTALGDERSILVKPGDVLYFPAGMWHKVETVEPGVSINISLMATNYATLVSQALCHFLYRDPRFREPIVNNSIANATDNLRIILKDLPDIVQQFAKSGGDGAQNILPPVLQYPPAFFRLTDEEDSDGEVDYNGEEVEVEEDEVGVFNERQRRHGGIDQIEVGEEMNAESKCEIDDEVEDSEGSNSAEDCEEESAEVHDPAGFTDYNPSWDFQLEIGSKIEIYKNPLGALHKHEEITSFYTTPDNDDDSMEEGRVFVLNVNYAGTQMHESAIRVLFIDNNQMFVQTLWDKERNVDDPTKDSPLYTCFVTETNHYLISFLVYHGYMQVKKVNK